MFAGEVLGRQPVSLKGFVLADLVVAVVLATILTGALVVLLEATKLIAVQAAGVNVRQPAVVAAIARHLSSVASTAVQSERSCSFSTTDNCTVTVREGDNGLLVLSSTCGDHVVSKGWLHCSSTSGNVLLVSISDGTGNYTVSVRPLGSTP